MNNLRKLRKERGIGQVEMAKLLGIGQSSYSRYESGLVNIPTDILTKIADFYEISTDKILGRDEDQLDAFGKRIKIEPELVAEDEYLIPVVASLRCGFGRAGEAIFKERKPVPVSYIKRWGKGIVYYESVGESMSPTITPGDLLITVPGSAWEDGWIVVADVNDSDTIKRIYRSYDNGIDLIPDNSKYKPMHLTPEELKIYNVAVLGHVVKVIGPDL